MSEFKMQIEEPQKTRGRGASPSGIEEVLAFAKGAKGKWCKVLECPTPAKAGSRACVWKHHSKSVGFEFRSRAVQNGSGKIGVVYCRYVGTSETA